MKILITTYYWPPAAGPGVQRALKMAKYFTIFGAEVDVLTVNNGTFPSIDQDLVNEIPDNVNVHKVQTKELFGIYLRMRGSKAKGVKIIKNSEISNRSNWITRLGLWIKSNCIFPDPRVGFYLFSKNKLDRLLVDQGYDIVLTSSPPHSVQLIGLRAKKKIPGLKWVADFRDPWANLYHNEIVGRSKLLSYLDKKKESEVLKKADLVLTTSVKTADSFRDRASQVLTVFNGFDEDDFVVEPQIFPDNQFTLSYVGGMGSTQNPENLWTALFELCRENEAFNRHFKMVFAGQMDESIRRDIGKYGLDEKFEHLGYISHSKAVSLMKGADILLLINPNTQRSGEIIPGKVFEYMAAKSPIINIGPESSDVRDVLELTGYKDNFNFEEVKMLKECILTYFENENVDFDHGDIEEYSRRSQYEKIYGALSSIIEV